VAYLHGNQPITAQELGEFLLARGGADKLELLVNKTIIEREAAKRKITVTDAEMTAALEADLAGFGFDKSQFVKVALARHGKTLFEWMEDTVRPRLLLSKMCQDKVKVTDEALRVQYERLYGEKRRVQLIIWPKGDDQKTILKIWEGIRSSQEEFDREARKQANPNLAAAAGYGKPISRYMPAEERVVEEISFQLKPGEVSQILNTSLGYVVVKLHEVIPPQAVKFEAVRDGLHKQAFDELLSAEIPNCFAELKKQANPTLLYQGPGRWQQLEAAKPATVGEVQKAAGVEPAKK
jgi:hypothetical protein